MSFSDFGSRNKIGGSSQVQKQQEPRQETSKLASKVTSRIPKQPPAKVRNQNVDHQKQLRSDLKKLVGGWPWNKKEKVDDIVAKLGLQDNLPARLGDKLHDLMNDKARFDDLKSLLSHSGFGRSKDAIKNSTPEERRMNRAVLLLTCLTEGTSEASKIKSQLYSAALNHEDKTEYRDDQRRVINGDALFSAVEFPKDSDPQALRSKLVSQMDVGVIKPRTARHIEELTEPMEKGPAANMGLKEGDTLLPLLHAGIGDKQKENPETHVACQMVSAMSYTLAREGHYNSREAISFAHHMMDLVKNEVISLPQDLGTISSRLNLEFALVRLNLPEGVEITEVPQDLQTKRLGNGAFNTVYSGQMKLDGKSTSVVFKPMQVSELSAGVGAGKLKIGNPPRQALRNVASSDLNKQLGWNVICDSRIGRFKDPDKGHETIGTVMARAPGDPLAQVDGLNIYSPSLLRELTKLQLMDAILGQGDRHSNNIMVEFNEWNGQVTVTGIDNDQCLGKDPTDPDELAPKFLFEKDADDSRRGVRMPAVVDTDMVRDLAKLTPEILRDVLRGKVTDEEVDTAVQRLAALKIHIQNGAQCQIINPSEWGNVNHETDVGKMPGKDDPQIAGQISFRNSYWARQARHVISD